MQDIGLDTVWCEHFPTIRFIVDHGFHYQWNKRFRTVVMGNVEGSPKIMLSTFAFTMEWMVLRFVSHVVDVNCILVVSTY